MDSIDENGEIEAYSDVCGFSSKALEKILTVRWSLAPR